LVLVLVWRLGRRKTTTNIPRTIMATAIARTGWSADESDTEEDGSIVEERCLIVDRRQ
jgi:hypothetical protein